MSTTENLCYKKARMSIQSGDLLAWSNDNAKGSSKFLINLIRFGTRSEYAHVGIACWIKDRLYVLEAVMPQIRMVPLSETESFYHIPMSIQWKDRDTEYLKTFIGLEYSVIECIKAYLGIPLNTQNKWQCAELANRIYFTLGIDLGNSFTPTQIVKEAMKRLNAPAYFIEIGE